MEKKTSRRRFISSLGLAGAGAVAGVPVLMRSTANATPAILGGSKAMPAIGTSWPIFGQLEETGLMNVVKSGVWGRLADNTRTAAFEKAYAAATGAKNALAVSSGTNALFAMLGALDIGPGDEVILPPYTFIATYNVIVLNYALPVFVDTDIESFQIDARKIEAAITPATKALLPVHIGGSPFDIDAVLQISKKHNIPMLEDACQAHLAEWKGKGVGNWGLGGAFSFQATKNLNSGEGGAIISNDETFYQKCYSFHHQGQSANSAGLGTGSGTRGSNLRISEFQSSILLSQLSRLKQQTETRNANAAYLTQLLSQIPGIIPAKLYPGTTRSAYHLYMFRYDSKAFAGMSREKFVDALAAEGVFASTGYGMINKEDYVTGLAKNPHYLKIYGEKRMQQWLDQTLQTPVNDRLTTEALWFTQTMLLGPRSDMDKIAQAIRKIHNHAKKIA
ncbi:DegT/DnrJ/EryC1/StrS family aminotransferase [Niabella beijingensis]|uniref:DegT/DnrJ/EryC1/StrS family aminotransferase n=1 Tax=Niabella beijingensis TaxID=2872700 RepID=UPI001CBAC732|nr:DegT/DnrJ/EryC1/StrS family aminotransferase [Niabella beijingensis]MBZ4188863.1 DegT/DnrJ/EryC1/StrS family aminotransferase [Niabella beijingensis]